MKKNVGLSSLSIYIPSLYLAHDDLALARNIPKEKFSIGLGNINMSIVPAWEDTVSMAANAADMAITAADIDKDDIGMIVVATESSVDQSKPIASYIQGLLKIGSNVKTYEVKHACYSGTVGLMNAVHWIMSGCNNGKKALVVMSDIARYGIGSIGEPTQGAGAVACIVSEDTDYITLNPERNVCYANDVHDFWRPNNSTTPYVDGKYSIECYLEALESCVSNYRKNLKKDINRDINEYLDYYVYHLPFTRMVHKAHSKLLSILTPSLSEDDVEMAYQQEFDKNIQPSLLGAQYVGNIYTGSVYMSLISLLESEGKSLVGKNIGVFSYGSGCGAEFFDVNVGEGLNKATSNFSLEKQLKNRQQISIEEYEDLYGNTAKESAIKVDDIPFSSSPYSKYYFSGVVDNKRQYVSG